MKKLYLLMAILAGSLSLMAQPCKYTITPATIDAYTSPITIIFDATGTAMEGETEAYLWSWAEGGGNMDICGPDWAGIYPSAKLTPVAGEANKFKLELPYTTEVKGETITFSTFADLFATSIAPGKLLHVGFMLRSLDGTKQTNGDMECDLRLSPLNFTDNEFRTFPSAISIADVVSVYLNPALSSNNRVKLMQDVKISFSFLDAEGNEVYATPEAVAAACDERGCWTYTFLPEKFVTVAAGNSLSDITKFKATFTGSIKTFQGETEKVEVAFEKEFNIYR